MGSGDQGNNCGRQKAGTSGRWGWQVTESRG